MPEEDDPHTGIRTIDPPCRIKLQSAQVCFDNSFVPSRYLSASLSLSQFIPDLNMVHKILGNIPEHQVVFGQEARTLSAYLTFVIDELCLMHALMTASRSYDTLFLVGDCGDVRRLTRITNLRV